MRRLPPLLILLAPIAAVASPPPSPSLLCDTAIVGAERAVRLPLRLLGAIAEVESGRLDDAGNVRPWPWTINAEGSGQFFATKRQAIDAVRTLHAQGVQSIDIGCMQVNLMHHPNAFASLDEAFDPTANALYAARFLNTLYGMSGSWVQATAAYHSQTPAIGADYQLRVMARWQHRGAPFGAPVMQTAYRDFRPNSQVYGAFLPADQVYGAFAEPAPIPTRLAHR
ncbi:MAG TPA: transglycosylase SLT domain-containing protein [Acetobacteraceae bacterium]|nr:transglycosylase SLT domain-containing protein [Acetobacteraceae bacterium]